MTEMERICGKPVIDSIAKAEPIGPKGLLDVLVICPCTGNTLAKLANGITDTAVTMAAKAHLRNGRPVVLCPATNDGLAASAKNIGLLLDKKNLYFVPFRQDDPVKKPDLPGGRLLQGGGCRRCGPGRKAAPAGAAGPDGMNGMRTRKPPASSGPGVLYICRAFTGSQQSPWGCRTLR